jgi:hypothetical protein
MPAGAGQDLEATHEAGRPAPSGLDQKSITTGEQFQSAANLDTKSLSSVFH